MMRIIAGRQWGTVMRLHAGRRTRAKLGRNACAAAAGVLTLAACTPTIRVQVAPINIYAKLDADVRVKLDKEVQSLVQQNPNLF